MQSKETLRWRTVETSDEDSSFAELCPCTLGHSNSVEAAICARRHDVLSNPKKLAAANKEKNCFGCAFYRNAQQPTKLTIHGKGVFHGTVFQEWCQRPELQTEESEYNEEYVLRDAAESVCADEDYFYFSPKNEAGEAKT